MKSALAIAMLLIVPLAAFAADPPGDPYEPEELGELDIEELAKIKITSSGRKPERLPDIPAAATVLSNADLRRSGALSIPEALRLAPGLEVARIDSGRYALSARGFNNEFPNKLLVLIDGRTIFTPAFNGVIWEAQDVMLEDVARIEVIRGPGGNLWGPNAVNGIVHVITKAAGETQGWLVAAGAGTEEHVFSSVRYGGPVGDETHYRVYAKGFDRDNLGGVDNGGLQHAQGGFRTDGPAAMGRLTLIGNVLGTWNRQTKTVPTLTPPDFQKTGDEAVRYQGFDTLARWTLRPDTPRETKLQVFYEYHERPADFTIRSQVHTLDVDFQDRHPFWRQDVVWGAGYRRYEEYAEGGFALDFVPRLRNIHILSVFVQDEINVVDKRLSLIPGARYEYVSALDVGNVLPDVRLRFTPDDSNTLWAAVAKSVALPARSQLDAKLAAVTLPGPTIIRYLGNPAVRSERVTTFEAGYRVRAAKAITADLSAFYSRHDHILSIEPLGFDSGRTPMMLDLRFDDKVFGETYGGEAALALKPWRNVMLRPSYTLLLMDLKTNGSLFTNVAPFWEGASPTHQALIWGQFDFADAWRADATVRYVSGLRTQAAVPSLPSVVVPAYTVADMRLAWKMSRELELSVVGRNLARRAHVEFSPQIHAAPGEARVQPEAYVRAEWRP